MKKFLILIYILLYPIYNFATYTFINSSPINAEIYLLNTDGKIKKIGITPMKSTNFSSNVKILFKKVGYTSVTNKISQSTKNQNIEVILSPLSFEIQFPSSTGGKLYVGKEPYTSLDGSLLLPYGNYDINYNKKKNALKVEYKSPYVPYIAFFSTVTVVSTIMAITGAILGSKAFTQYQNANSSDQAIDALETTSLWDTITWTGVSLSTAGLIGTSISAALEIKEKRRMKRFNGMNKSTASTDCLSAFQEILLLGVINPQTSLEKINQFIKDFKQSRFLSEIYLKRASIYILNDQLKKAEKDLKLIINKYPTLYSYEMANKLLADLYLTQKNYKLSYQYYKESLEISKIYPYNELKFQMLDSLYQLATEKESYQKLFLEESKDMKGLNTQEKKIIKQRILQFIK